MISKFKLSVVFVSLLFPTVLYAEQQKPCWAPNVLEYDSTQQVTVTRYAKLRTDIEGVELEAPEQDAKKKLAYGDHRLLGVVGFTIEFPPLDKFKDDEIICALGTRVPDGLGDVIESDEHNELMTKWYRYAVKYNKVIVHAYRSGEIKL
ncbi:hypothetical protein EYS14_19870 [Alteromonadaceae bacterium M269]|nr:hypothetical protein EYS14_19870 [Alteromonadaceae bacterium M269]